MSEIREIDKQLAKELSNIKLDKSFISSVFAALDTDEKKREMIDYLQSGKELKVSDVYIKEMQINNEIKV